MIRVRILDTTLVTYCLTQGEHYSGRSSLARDLDIIESGSSTSLPLLAEVIKRSTGGNATSTPRGRSASGTEVTGGKLERLFR